ncbi:uncharacterized protein HMPREF1541_05389 [Cyphellophora europaea CBS 101466]|uniref:Uncharacterized protein n=1 Tax=Cyphellophora europaea (strain CBS 101466) TaxID=1220924 RepID=W2RRL3_CYPE1|nr:uncharacterized protein HMPREF1541_05389 [Cyphellophora europaea CBS 101466]ETN39166.1 hypothetical protein HMPREF1541_05389 [Cyphellophora europaea CBS 101466]
MSSRPRAKSRFVVWKTTKRSQSPTRTAERQHGIYWRRSWLTNAALSAVGILLSCLAAGLVVLRQSSLRTNGIETLTDNHYLWTYGPTALLVFVAAAWRQLDHEVKILVPWAVLKDGNAQAEKSLRLDYVSPLQIVSFAQAIGNKHFAVPASVFGFALLKGITLASTALLDVRDVAVEVPSDSLVQTSRFDGTLFNATAFTLGTDSSLVYNAFGISSYGLERQDGIGDGFAYETFLSHPTPGASDIEFRANVRTFVPDFGCAPAHVTINPEHVDTQLTNASRGRIAVTSPRCSFTGVEPTFLLDKAILESQVVPNIQRRASMQRVDCDDFRAPGSQTDNIQLLVLAEIEYAQEFPDASESATRGIGDEVNVTSWSANVRRTKSIVCNPHVSITNSSILYETSQTPVRAVLAGGEGPPSLSEAFTDDDLANAFTASILDGAGLFGVASAANSLLEEESPNTMFRMMADTVFHERSEIGPSGYEALLNDDVGDDIVSNAANTVFRAVASQIIHKNIRRTIDEPLPGRLSFRTKRLVVTELSLWFMFGGLLLLVLVTIAVWCVRPRPALPHHPESLIALAGHIPPNEELVGLVNSSRDLDSKGIDAMLRAYRFGTSWCLGPLDKRPVFEVYSTRPATASSPLVEPEPRPDDKHHWWTPLMLRPTMVALTLVLPVLTIATLEGVHQASLKRPQGTIVLIDEDDASSALVWLRTVPALTMLLIATLFNSIDFNIALLGPLSALKMRSMSVPRFPDRSFVGDLPPVTLWRAARLHLWPVAASTTAALVGSVLTIVISGLFTFDPASEARIVDLPKIEGFDTTTKSALIDPADAAALCSLLESSNLSYPINTYAEFVFPSLGSTEDLDETGSAVLDLNIPALRASLGCVALASDAVNITVTANPRINAASVSLNARARLPEGCQRGGPDGTLPFIEIPFSQQISGTTNESYVGKLLSLHVGPYNSPIEGSVGETAPNQPDNPPGCPSLALIYGHVDLISSPTPNLTTLVCTQHLQSLASHTFLTATQRILNTTLLSADPDVEPFLPASPTDPNITAFPFRIQQPLDQTLSIFNQTTFPSAANAATPVDHFFQGVLFGKTGLFASPAGEAAFASVEDADRRVVFESVQKFYRRYMAQAVSLAMRQPLPAGAVATAAAAQADAGNGTEDGEGEVWRVTVHNGRKKLKLTMHQESKVALQAMLAAMVLLMGYAVWAVRAGREVVKGNPCQIWGRLQLVVGGPLAGEVYRGVKEGEEPWGREGAGGSNSSSNKKVLLGWWDLPSWKGSGKRWGIDLVREGVGTALAGKRRLAPSPQGRVSEVRATPNVRSGWI